MADEPVVRFGGYGGMGFADESTVKLQFTAGCAACSVSTRTKTAGLFA